MEVIPDIISKPHLISFSDRMATHYAPGSAVLLYTNCFKHRQVVSKQ